MSNTYIMKHASEPERIRLKTSPILTSRQLHWIGLQNGQSFLDVGCASGEVTRAAARISRTGKVVGLDGDREMLAYAKAEADQREIENVQYLQANVSADSTLPFRDNTFDHVWTRFFLEYQPNPLPIIEEMVRVAKRGGAVSLLDLDGNCIWHHPMPEGFKKTLGEIITYLSTTGFDPVVGTKLSNFATLAGLQNVRETVEGYHQIIGTPSPEIAAHWQRKIKNLEANYLENLFPEHRHHAGFFEEFLTYIQDPKTMTWSNIHLVQGVKV